jgi:hypothetical protein
MTQGLVQVFLLLTFLFSVEAAQCPGLCSDLYIPVCTTDNQTYPNQCTADCANATVTCKHACPCGNRKSMAEEVNKMAKSKCPGLCSDLYIPVCTTDNQTYPNQCTADCANATVTCKHACPCGNRKSMAEEVDKMAKELDRVVIARCNCTNNFKPVCTDEKQTLPNQCIADCINATVACKHACPCSKPKLIEEELEIQGECNSSRRHLLVPVLVAQC